MRILTGRFNYSSTATVRDRGRVRKERFEPRAFRFAIEDETRQIDILVGHSFDKPLASRKAGTLEIADGDDGVTFEARLPDDPPSWVIDAERAIAAGLMTGLSPGFVNSARVGCPGRGAPGAGAGESRSPGFALSARPCCASFPL